MLDCGYETDAGLYAKIKAVAERVRNNAAKLAKRAWHERLERTEIDQEEYTVLSESATFLAFVELGGDSDRPESFDWENPGLVTIATKHVRRDLQEKGSYAHDIARRNSWRKDVALNEGYRWDAWDDRAGERRHEREQVADAVSGLLPELETVLNQRDLQLLRWKYVEDRSQKEIAELLGVQLGAAVMGIKRAKDKAASALGDVWHKRVLDAVLSG